MLRSVSVVWGISFYPGDGEGEHSIVSRGMEEIELFSNTNIRENLWRLSPGAEPVKTGSEGSSLVEITGRLILRVCSGRKWKLF